MLWSTHRLSVVLATGALGAGLVVTAPAAQALPVYIVAEMEGSSTLFNSGGTPCSGSSTVSAPAAFLPVAENGAPTTYTITNHGTITNDDDSTDVMTADTSLTATGTVTSVRGNPRDLDVITTGSIAVSTTKATSACLADGQTYTGMQYTVLVAEGGFLTLSIDAGAHAYGTGFLIEPITRERFASVNAQGEKAHGTVTVFLPPGRYDGYLEAGAQFVTSTTIRSTPIRVATHGAFSLAGSMTQAVSGKGKRFVSLPSARSCTSHTLTAAVTSKRKRVRSVKKVEFFVNDQLVQKVRKPDRGSLVTLALPDEVQAGVRAEVTLVRARPGRPARHVVTSAAYEACG